ncbi:apolipoprotein L3-like [Hyperolius riggenbachi]|uniref:apolipoprotein L3-like n=1 Tax=Hyperolius riggenbachi TaxID=752182 RepID=UPI0035A3116A
MESSEEMNTNQSGSGQPEAQRLIFWSVPGPQEEDSLSITSDGDELSFDDLRILTEGLEDKVNEAKDIDNNLKSNITPLKEQLLGIANDIDTFHKGATIASVAGSSVGIAGGITTIVGLALAPFTLGASLIVTGVGIAAATAGGLTGASASIADTVNIKAKCKKAEEMLSKIAKDLKRLETIFNDISKTVTAMHAFQMTARGMNSTIQVVRLASFSEIPAAAARSAQLAGQGLKAITVISGVFAALFILVDAAFVVKGAIELHKGAKTEEAKKIREAAEEIEKQYHELHEQSQIVLNGSSTLTEQINHVRGQSNKQT